MQSEPEVDHCSPSAHLKFVHSYSARAPRPLNLFTYVLLYTDNNFGGQTTQCDAVFAFLFFSSNVNSSSSLPSSSLSFPSQGLPQHHSSSGCNLTDKLLFFSRLKIIFDEAEYSRQKNNFRSKNRIHSIVNNNNKKKVYCQGSATLKINLPMPRCSCSLILHRDAA